MPEIDLGNERILKSVGVLGKSGAWNNLKPDMHINRLSRDMVRAETGMNLIKKEKVKPLFIRYKGKLYAAGGPSRSLMEYIGLKWELSCIMGNMAEVDQELKVFEEEYLPEELRERK